MKLLSRKKGRKVCPNCGKRFLSLDSQEDAKSIGYNVNGIITNYNCHNCCAEVEVFVAEKEED